MDRIINLKFTVLVNHPVLQQI